MAVPDVSKTEKTSRTGVREVFLLTLIDHDGAGDLLAGVVARGLSGLGVGTRLGGELGGLAAEQALLLIGVSDLRVIGHHAVRLQQSAGVVGFGLGQRHSGQLLGPVEADALRLGLDPEHGHTGGVHPDRCG